MDRPTPIDGRQPRDAAAGDPAADWLALRLATFLGAMALWLAVATLPASALFEVRAITVRGAETMSDAAVIALSGLRPGERLLAVDPWGVARRIERDPRIRNAAIRIAPPDRVTVEVAERRPVAALRSDGGYLVLDAAAVPFARASSPGTLVALEVEGPPPRWVRLGQPVPSPAVAAGVRAVAALDRRVRDEVAALRVDRAGEATLVTRDAIAVRAGDLRRLGERTAMLPQILAAVRARGVPVEYVDIRFSGSVIIKPVGAPARGGDTP